MRNHNLHIGDTVTAEIYKGKDLNFARRTKSYIQSLIERNNKLKICDSLPVQNQRSKEWYDIIPTKVEVIHMYGKKEMLYRVELKGVIK